MTRLKHNAACRLHIVYIMIAFTSYIYIKYKGQTFNYRLVERKVFHRFGAVLHFHYTNSISFLLIIFFLYKKIQ